MSIVVDSSALFALLDGDDENFTRASSTWKQLPDADLVVHAYVIGETLAIVRRRLGWQGVEALVDELIPSLRVEMVDRELHDRALTAYRAERGGRSFVDHVTIAFARRERIEQVFAYDRDLQTDGLALVG